MDKAARKAEKQRIRTLIRESKAVPCTDCGVQYPYYVMQFDHVRGVKRFNIGNSAGRHSSMVRAEIEKCDVVCANCHAHRTHVRLSST